MKIGKVKKSFGEKWKEKLKSATFGTCREKKSEEEKPRSSFRWLAMP